jgi:hypothetical protein
LIVGTGTPVRSESSDIRTLVPLVLCCG